MKRLLFLVLCLASFGASFGQYDTHWQPVGGFESNMTVEAIVYIDNVEQFSETLELGAFCGDECRGAVLPIEDAGQMWYFLLFGGVNNEQITFRLYDHATSQELGVECENILTYVSDGDIDPYDVYFTTPSSTTTNTTSGDWNDPLTWGGTGPTPEANVQVGIGNVTIGDGGASTVTVASLEITAGATLTIEPGSTLIVTGDLTNADEDGLVIKDGAQVINESVNVKATAQKSISAYTAKDSDGWYTISSPVDEMAIAGSDFLTPAYDLYRYNENPESGLEWENYKDNSNVDFTTFENGRGYLYANSNTFSPSFVGTLNAASVARTLTCSESPDGLSGFNLIGNPFPHAIYKGEGGAIDNANLASGFYSLNNEGAWRVNTFEDAIMPGQGILVKTTANTNLTIVKSNTEATAESNGAKNAIGRVCVTVTGGNGEDRAFVYFGQGIGLNKMRGFTDQTPILWVRDNNTDYAIAHVGKGCESLDLFFHNKNNGEFRLSVNTKDITFGVLQLVDNLTGEIIDLKQHPDYSFHANGNEADGRFKLVFRLPSGVEETAEAEPFAFVIDGRIVLVDVDELAELQVVDLTGRIVSKDGLTPGIYVLRLTNGNETRTQKIVVK